MASIFYVLFFVFCSFFLFCDGLHWPCVNAGLDNISKRPIKVNLLMDGTRPIGRPKLRYKDTYNSALKCGAVRDECQLKVKKKTITMETTNSSNMRENKWEKLSEEEGK